MIVDIFRIIYKFFVYIKLLFSRIFILHSAFFPIKENAIYVVFPSVPQPTIQSSCHLAAKIFRHPERTHGTRHYRRQRRYFAGNCAARRERERDEARRIRRGFSGGIERTAPKRKV